MHRLRKHDRAKRDLDSAHGWRPPDGRPAHHVRGSMLAPVQAYDPLNDIGDQRPRGARNGPARRVPARVRSLPQWIALT